MSRKRNQPPISLFSFQDIITSVTAIMIVIVICLTLELLERDTTSAEPAAWAAVEELQAAVMSLRVQLEKLQSRGVSDPTLLTEAAAVTPNQVHHQISELNRRLEAANAALKREQARAGQLQQESIQTDALRFNASAELEELEQLKDRVRRAEVRLQDLEDLKRPIYTMPRGSSLDGWLVVVNGDSIEAARVGVSAPPIAFHGAQGSLGFKPSAASAFLKWVDASSGRQRYYMLVVRPGGAETFDTIEEGLANRRVSYGFDVTGADQPLLDPAVGAGAP